MALLNLPCRAAFIGDLKASIEIEEPWAEMTEVEILIAGIGSLASAVAISLGTLWVVKGIWRDIKRDVDLIRAEVSAWNSEEKIP